MSQENIRNAGWLVDLQRRFSDSQKGFGLLEVLIALLIFSIGLLSLAGLQIRAKQINYEAVQRTAATTLANDLMERMRMMAEVSGTAPLGGYVKTCNSSYTLSDPLTDFDNWCNLMLGATETKETKDTSTKVGGLIEPTGCITGPTGTGAGGPGIYTITIAWRGQNKLKDASTTTCGSYGSSSECGATGANCYKRWMSVSTYITTQ